MMPRGWTSAASTAALRSDIEAGEPADALDQSVQVMNTLLGEAERKLAEGEMSPAAAFTSSLLILLRRDWRRSWCWPRSQSITLVLTVAVLLAGRRSRAR